MSNEAALKLGEELKSLREEKGVTLQQIHNKTRIDLKYLKAIENGEFSIMPDIYMRAFVKEYAQAIQLSPEAAVKKYEAALKGKLVSADEEDIKKESVQESEDKKPVKKEFDSNLPNDLDSTHKTNDNKNILIYGGIASVIIILIAVYFLLINNDSQEIITETPVQEILKEQKKDRFTIKEPDQKTKPVQPQSDQFKLLISSIDTVWIRARVDDEDQEFMLMPQNRKEIEASQEITLLIGNSGGVELFLNDKKLDFQGESGRVRNVKITSDGFEYINNEPARRNE